MYKKRTIWIISAIIFISTFIYLLFGENLINLARYEFMQRKDLCIHLAQISSEVKTLSAESSNKLVLAVKVKTKAGDPVPMADVVMSSTNNLGRFEPERIRTDRNGEIIVSYSPPDLTSEQPGKDGIEVSLKAGLTGTDINSAISIKLVRVPIVMVHGYFETAAVFDNMKEHLVNSGYTANAMTFNSLSGILASTSELNNYLLQQRKTYMAKGFKVNKFDIIAHSLGGLVVRYYTCNSDYVFKDNIRKVIFISVPQKGSPWAPIGTTYFKDQGIKDLIPDSAFFTNVLPSLNNKGLNKNIQVGSIMVEYDEVVSPESASLSEWDIKTEVFNIGGNSFTMEMLFNGNLMQAPNHKNILSNKKAFEMVEKMLNTNLPYPAIRN